MSFSQCASLPKRKNSQKIVPSYYELPFHLRICCSPWNCQTIPSFPSSTGPMNVLCRKYTAILYLVHSVYFDSITILPNPLIINFELQPFLHELSAAIVTINSLWLPLKSRPGCFRFEDSIFILKGHFHVTLHFPADLRFAFLKNYFLFITFLAIVTAPKFTVFKE